MNKIKIQEIIPVKISSERVKNKNLRKFGDTSSIGLIYALKKIFKNNDYSFTRFLIKKFCKYEILFQFHRFCSLKIV